MLINFRLVSYNVSFAALRDNLPVKYRLRFYYLLTKNKDFLKYLESAAQS